MAKRTQIRTDQIICIPNLKTYTSSQEKLKLNSSTEFFFKVSNIQSESQLIPRFLLKCILLTGLLAESDKHTLYKITTSAFNIIIVFSIISAWISTLIQYEFYRFKIKFADLMSFMLALGIFYAMRCKRRSLSKTIRMLSKISLCPHKKIINFVTFLLCILPIAYSIASISVGSLRWLAKYHAYGNSIHGSTRQILLISFKCFQYALVHPTFTNMVALLYCVLCQCCTSALANITQEILQLKPKQFSPHKQLDILRRKAKIDDILGKLQNIFSLPIFFLIAGNFLTCGSVIGKHLNYGTQQYRSYHIKESSFYGISSFCCLTATLWVAGGVSNQFQKLKEAFHKKEKLRLLNVTSLDEPTLKKGYFEETDFVFTGCDIIFYKRSTILTLFGALLTYTVLAVSTD